MKTKKQAQEILRADKETRFPNGCELKAEAAAQAGEHNLAAAWYRAAMGATIGHTRGERYREAAYEQDVRARKLEIEDTLQALNAGRATAAAITASAAVAQIDAAIERLQEDLASVIEELKLC